MFDLEIFISIDKICASNRGYTNNANKFIQDQLLNKYK